MLRMTNHFTSLLIPGQIPCHYQNYIIYIFRIFLLRYQLFTPNQGINLEGIQRIGKQARAVFLPIIMVSEIMYKKEQH